MSKHLCHWTRKDMHRVVGECCDADISIEHIILLDMLDDGRRNMFSDPLKDFLDDAEQEDLEAIWGKANGSLLYGAAQDGVDMELLRRIGGFFVLGYFRPPDKDEVRLNEKGEVFGYGLAYCQYPLRAWSPCLHTAIGKCLSQAARTRRNILREGREIALRKREA